MVMKLMGMHEEGGVSLPSAVPLTVREAEVVRLLAKGFTTKQIAETLGMRFYTASTHLKNIYRKFGTHRRAEVMVRVLAGGGQESIGQSAANPLAGHPVKPGPVTNFTRGSRL